MNVKIMGGLVIIVLVVVGAWYYMAHRGSGSPGGASAATSTPQVQGQDVSIGTGAVAGPGSQVSVLYVGKLQDGTVFDSSSAHQNQPLTFTLGTQGIIPGFQIGVNGMKVGGERLLSIPPELGYGSQDVKDVKGKVIVPASSTLIFDVKLVDVKAASASGTPAAQ